MRIIEEEYREAYLLWKEQNPSKTHVQQSTIVTLSSGKGIPLGRRISRMKLIYKSMQEEQHYQTYKDLTEEDILWWKNQGVDLSTQKRTSYTEEEYREAYLLWKKQNPKKRCPITKEIVTLPGGKKIPLGLRINRMKRIYHSMQEEQHYQKYKDLTEEDILWWKDQGVDLDIQKRVIFTEEEYREAYLLWKKENKDVMQIHCLTEITLMNGKKIPLGHRANTMKTIYRAMQEGKHYGKCKDLTEEQINWWIEHGFKFEIEESCKKVSKKPLKKEKKNQDIKNIGDLLVEFHMDIGEWIRNLESAKIKQKQKIDAKPLEVIEEQTLRSFCFKEGYQYSVVSKAIKLHSFLKEEPLEQLINRVLLEKQEKQDIASWVFEVYGSMIGEILEKLNLNSEQVLRDVSRLVIPLEEAICRLTFQTMCKQEECDYLEDIYKKVIAQINFQSKEEEIAEKIVKKIVRIGKRNHLMPDEIDILKNCLFRCLKVIREYQIISMGLELDEKEKLEKARKYNFTEEEIEESYFVPFYFEEGILLGEKSDLYKRRELLRQYIIDWDYYTEEEKQCAKEEQHFTEEEFSMMKETRREINQAIEKIQKVKK